MWTNDQSQKEEIFKNKVFLVCLHEPLREKDHSNMAARAGHWFQYVTMVISYPEFY